MNTQPPDGHDRSLSWQAVQEALADLWRDYHWPVKLLFALVVLSSIWAASIVGWPEWDANTPRWLKAVASDPFRNLLTLIIAFLVAVNFYMRARRGVLDGDEHYNVARALAFGYFKNFLVPALQLAKNRNCQLQIFRPETMQDLQRYTSKLQQRILDAMQPQWLPLVEQPRPGGPPRRTVLALQSPRADQQHAETAFFFDAPTALFTVEDFYKALNRRREDSGKQPLNEATLCRYQNGQIDSFFSHLEFLFATAPGLAAVADIVTDQQQLLQLRQQLQEVTIAELEQRYPAAAPGN